MNCSDRSAYCVAHVHLVEMIEGSCSSAVQFFKELDISFPISILLLQKEFVYMLLCHLEFVALAVSVGLCTALAE